MTDALAQEPSPVVWDADGTPRSQLYGDVYFAAEGGLAESQAVFLAGCGLPQAWRDRDHFTVGELGFGTGLSIAALLELWRRTSPPHARLSIFSVEAHPLAVAEARRALTAWPQIGEAAEALLSRWPSGARGFQRIVLPDFRATLDVATMEAADALRAWTGRADAWFLDGFAPATNPAMWREEVLGLVAQRSAPGARLATFTVAGQVRRGLATQGFEVAKRPGHGRKRERLEAWLEGTAPRSPPPGTVAIIGAGVAGCALYRALRAQGAEPILIDAEKVAAGASGNPAAVVLPGLDASSRGAARLYAQAFDFAVRQYLETAPQAVILRGVARLEAEARDAGRFDQVVRQAFFPAGAAQRTDAEAMANLAQEPAPAGLMFTDGLVIEPEAALGAWAGEGPTIAQVSGMEARGAGFRLTFADGTTLDVGTVVVAAGWGANALAGGLGLRPVRGQASFADLEGGRPALVFGAYAIPTRDGVLFGATHDRGRTDLAIDAADHGRNLAAVGKVLPQLAERLSRGPLQGRAGVRATTPDHLPLAGWHSRSRLFVLTGLGSRGFTTAPLMAEHVAALMLGRPSPLPEDLARLVDPDRFTGKS